MNPVTRERVLAFRLGRQTLSARAQSSELLAVAASGVQNTPPSSAVLALGARLNDLDPGDLDRALGVDKSLVQLWSLRAAPYVVPVADAAVFTTGLLPDGEEACLFLMRGAAEHLRRFNWRAEQAVELTAEAVRAVLADGSELTKDELGVRLAGHLAPRLKPAQLAAWNAEDGLGNNTYGQSLVRYALSVVSLHGLVCTAPARGPGAARFVFSETWLGGPLPALPVEAARAELVRRFLHYLGPGDAVGFARWAGVSPAYAAGSWKLVQSELTPVACDRRTLWLRAADLDVLDSAELPRGTRLLPPHDPYLAAHDKATILPDKTLQPRVWRTTTNPGAVLMDGEVAGLWHPAKQGGQLTLRVEPFRRLSPAERGQIEQEAQRVAMLRAAQLAAVEYQAATP